MTNIPVPPWKLLCPCINNMLTDYEFLLWPTGTKFMGYIAANFPAYIVHCPKILPKPKDLPLVL